MGGEVGVGAALSCRAHRPKVYNDVSGCQLPGEDYFGSGQSLLPSQGSVRYLLYIM